MKLAQWNWLSWIWLWRSVFLVLRAFEVCQIGKSLDIVLVAVLDYFPWRDAWIDPFLKLWIRAYSDTHNNNFLLLHRLCLPDFESSLAWFKIDYRWHSDRASQPITERREFENPPERFAIWRLGFSHWKSISAITKCLCRICYVGVPPTLIQDCK